MTEQYVFNNPTENAYLHLSSGAIDPSRPRHHYGPGARSGFMVHFVLSGKGTFVSHGVKYHLTTGDMFCCIPGYTVDMLADNYDPWTLKWVRFTGKFAAELMDSVSLSARNPVSDLSHAASTKAVMDEIFETSHQGNVSELAYADLLIKLIATLQDNFPKGDTIASDEKQQLFQQAVQFMRNNYDTPISISDVVSFIGIDRSYLYKLFQAYMQTSPKDYLDGLRTHRAMEMLKKTSASIKVVAISCGYANYLQFTRSFQKRVGVSPSIYRADNRK